MKVADKQMNRDINLNEVCLTIDGSVGGFDGVQITELLKLLKTNEEPSCGQCQHLWNYI